MTSHKINEHRTRAREHPQHCQVVNKKVTGWDEFETETRSLSLNTSCLVLRQGTRKQGNTNASQRETSVELSRFSCTAFELVEKEAGGKPLDIIGILLIDRKVNKKLRKYWQIPNRISQTPKWCLQVSCFVQKSKDIQVALIQNREKLKILFHFIHHLSIWLIIKTFALVKQTTIQREGSVSLLIHGFTTHFHVLHVTLRG